MPKPSSPGDLPFWLERHGLDLTNAHLRPGGRELELRFRFGQAYRIDLAALGFGGAATLASPGRSADRLVLFLGEGQVVEIASSRLLAAADPIYRSHLATLETADRPVGARIRALRKRARRTAAEVARAAGMTPGNYARLEADRHEPRVSTLRRVAEVLGTPVKELL